MAFFSSTLRRSLSRSLSTMPAAPIDGIVVGVSPEGAFPSVAAAAAQSDAVSQAKAAWAPSRADASKYGQLRVTHPSAELAVASVSLGSSKPAPTTGPDTLPSSEIYLRNERLERTRSAAAKGAKALRDLGPAPSAAKPEAEDGKPAAPTTRTFAVDPMNSAHAAAEGAHLSLFKFNNYKTLGGAGKAGYGLPASQQAGREFDFVSLAGPEALDEGDELKDLIAAHSIPQLGWKTGEVYAKAQNWARELKEAPANDLTPTIFAGKIVEAFKGLPNTQVNVYDEDWAREKGMNVFLSVTQGTAQPAKFVEIIYTGATEAASPKLGFVGKGVCFDSGGTSLKPGAGMKLMRADMGGAASVVASVKAIAELQLPINVVAATPLVENLPGGKATKPGDIFKAMNGLTVEVDNTDAEGRLILSDALTYISREHKPHTLLDVATLTGAILHALGTHYTGTFTDSDSLWKELKSAGEAENDLFWRMPLDDQYLHTIDTSNADLCNRGMPAGSATAAIFLKQFVEGLEDRSKLDKGEGKPTVRWAHLDIAGSMEDTWGREYQAKGALTGRPTRALIEFARRFAVLHHDE